MPTVTCPKCAHEFDHAPPPTTGRGGNPRCRAIKRGGNPCRQTTDLDADGYCKYHQTPKYKTPSPPPTSPTVVELETITPPPKTGITTVIHPSQVEEVED